VAGDEKTSTRVASLVDTNILVYRFDARDRVKQGRAKEILREGLLGDHLVLAHQSVIEFIAAVTRPRRELGGAPLLSFEKARLEAEQLLAQFPVLYPDRAVLITALRATAMYGLSWFDAHLWAYAEVNGVGEILSEDFEHGRHYGTVRVVNPFLSAEGVHELPALYETEPEPSASAARSSRARAHRPARSKRARPLKR
jgi:predicted nucleic acid-binding protein